jgi:hypothetical protein
MIDRRVRAAFVEAWGTVPALAKELEPVWAEAETLVAQADTLCFEARSVDDKITAAAAALAEVAGCSFEPSRGAQTVAQRMRAQARENRVRAAALVRGVKARLIQEGCLSE